MIRKFAFTICSIAVLVPGFALCQTVTAPLSPDQPLANPAAGVTRAFSSLSIHAGRKTEDTQVTDLVDSTYEVKEIVNTYVLNASWSWHFLFIEANTSPQTGTQNIDNTVTSGSATSDNHTSNAITLTPAQGLVGIRFGSCGAVGVKMLTSWANFTTASKYETKSASTATQVNETASLSARFSVLGFGATGRLAENIFVSYAAENTKLESQRKLNGTATTTYADGDQKIATAEDGRQTREIRKDTYGIGYVQRLGDRNLLRAEVSYATMPPLNDNLGLNNGERLRAAVEVNWSIFHAGVEVATTRGFYVDPYDLIPYYLKFQNLSNSSSTDYGLSGGFRSSKGHSISASFFTSHESKQEKLSFSDPALHQIDRTTVSMGINYAYLF